MTMMTSHLERKYDIKQTHEEGFDIEEVNVRPPSSASLAAAKDDTIGINPAPESEGMEKNEIEIIGCEMKQADNVNAALDQGHILDHGSSGKSSAVTNVVSFFINKKTVTFALFGACVALAAFAWGAVEHNQNQQQQQKALAVTAVRGKTGKPGPICPAEPVVTCGATFINQAVVLSESIFCTQTDVYNFAVTLEGPDAVINCKGFTVATAKYFTDPNNNGILLKDGAKAINCKVRRFHDGFVIENGGTVKKSEANSNYRSGVYVAHTTGAETEISDVLVYGSSTSGIHVESGTDSTSTVTLKNVISEHNGISGMVLKGSGITVKDCIIRHNTFNGILIDSTTTAAMINFEGTVSSYQNGYYGVAVSGNSPVLVHIWGVLNIYRQEMSNGYGLLNSASSAEFIVEESGAVNACQNGYSDIFDISGGSASFEGVYTCDELFLTATFTCQPCPVCD